MDAKVYVLLIPSRHGFSTHAKERLSNIFRDRSTQLIKKDFKSVALVPGTEVACMVLLLC